MSSESSINLIINQLTEDCEIKKKSCNVVSRDACNPPRSYETQANHDTTIVKNVTSCHCQDVCYSGLGVGSVFLWLVRHAH